MRNSVKSGAHNFGDRTNSTGEEGELSMASLQLDELLLELSREAGFKTRSTQKGNKNKGVITTKEGGGRTFMSWETEDGMMKQFTDQGSNQFRSGYYSDADIDADKTVSPKQKVINIEYKPKQRNYSAKVIEKTQTRQEYIKEEYLGNKESTSGANRFEDQVGGAITVDGRTSSVGTLSNEMRGSQFQSQKMYSSDVEGVKVAPIPPPRKHIASPDPSFASSGIQFQTNMKQHHQHDFLSNTLSPVSSTSTLRKGRFETTNSQHLSPPLEVKGITSASSSTYEEHRWLEEQKKKLERSRFSVDRITATGHVDHSYRSGSLDIDLDDLVQRNLTNRTVAVHRVASTPGVSESGGSFEKGSYYISGIERPAVKTKLPQTKYIFKITSPDEPAKPPAPKKMEKEIFTTHISAPPIPPSPQLDPGPEPNLGDLECSLKLMLDTNEYREQETFSNKLRSRQDDEVISLEPIGPGVQLLEPEIGTLKGQTLKYQEVPSRIESRSNSLARNVATPRTLSPSNLGYNTMTSYPTNQANNNFTMFESYTKQANTIPQPMLYQPQLPANMTSHVSRKENFESSGPIDNLATQQHFQQQQQLQPLPPQPYFVSPAMTGGFKSEQYSSMKYSQTVSNGPFHQSLPASPIMAPKPIEYVTSNQSQREISIPIAIEGRSNTLMSDAGSQRHVPSSASNFNYHDTENSGFAANQMTREASGSTLSRQIPVVQGERRANETFGVSTSGASVGGGYKFEDRKTEAFSRVEQSVPVSHPASPDVSRSWTVSPSSSAMATNMSSFKTESEKRNESSSLQITENQSSQTSLTDFEAKLVRDSAHIWHKPHITRQEAVEMLRNKPSGSFVVRNSHSFAGGYGLALKVSHLPPNVQAKGDDYEANLVRHYLIESTPKGVKLKGCSNEPVFPSLSALIYQHSITPLSLPCKLLVPEDKQIDNRSINQSFNYDYANNNNINTVAYTETVTAHKNMTTTTNNTNNRNKNMGTLASVNSQLSANSFGVSDTSVYHGPALYIDSFNTESLTGPEALKKSIQLIMDKNLKNLSVNKVDFRVSSKGVVLTDSKHKLFFRRHYPLEFISYCAVEQSGKNWTISDNDGKTYTGRIFGFVAKTSGSPSSNTCHLFLEIDQSCSATTIVSLIDSLQN